MKIVVKTYKSVLRSKGFRFTKAGMANENQQPDRMWDEYDWERFFQVQDRKTEQYLDLLEKYADSPDRDHIIAQEMGWPPGCASDQEIQSASEAVDARHENAAAEESFSGEQSPEHHPLYVQTETLAAWLENAWRVRAVLFEGEPALDELSEQLGILSANIVAALSGQDDEELGMTIAFLKRGLRAANLALNATEQVHRKGIFGRVRHKHLRESLFGIRDGIVQMMGEFRVLWRRRKDGSR